MTPNAAKNSKPDLLSFSISILFHQQLPFTSKTLLLSFTVYYKTFIYFFCFICHATEENCFLSHSLLLWVCRCVFTRCLNEGSRHKKIVSISLTSSSVVLQRKQIKWSTTTIWLWQVRKYANCEKFPLTSHQHQWNAKRVYMNVDIA